MLFKFCFFVLLSTTLCHEARVGVVEEHDGHGDEKEMVTIELKKTATEEGSNDFQLMVQLHFHLIEGNVNVNGVEIKHGVVNALHMNVLLVEIAAGGINKPPRLAPVVLRVLVSEEPGVNGKKLIVEEQFLEIDHQEVIQVDVKQVIWESLIRQPVTSIKLKDSKIYKHEKLADKHVRVPAGPRHPGHGISVDKDDEQMYEGYDTKYHHCLHRHHWHHANGSVYHYDHHHRHGFGKKVKCWYHHLSLKAKIALFSAGFLFLLTVALCCSICAKKRRSRTLEVTADAVMDNTVTVDVEDEKKLGEKADDKSYNFHFEFDENTVVVDDKKNLIE